jgi:Rap1a immunity proteins
MKRLVCLLAALAAPLLIGEPGFCAEPVPEQSSHELIASCVADNPLTQGQCIGFLQGLYFGVILNRGGCPPDMTVFELLDLLKQEAERDPRAGGFTARVVLTHTLQAKFPCR